MSDSLYREATVRAPTPSHLRKIAERIGLDIDDADLNAYHQSAKAACDAINEVEMLPEPILPTKYPRTPGYRPPAAENKLNAWYWKTDIVGARRGKLLGKTVAIKDNIAVAGVPMMVGCSALEGYVPEFDATVVTRILDEGGLVKGKTVCEGLCAAGASYTCNKGPVKNFHNPNHNAGGSSCGSATLVASGEVDLALGSDQGGSIRIPASWCGLVGIKPTFGLVPYTGSMAFEPSVDHLGPLARTVHDCALFLEVLAGYDNGLDPRQRSDIKVPQYATEMKVDNLDGLKIGLVKEGFEMPDADDRVHEMVKKSLYNLQNVGAEVKEVSLPLHKKGGTIWRMVYTEGFSDTTFRYGGAGGRGSCGFYPTSLSSFALKSFRSRINDVSHSPKLYYLLGEYFSEAYPGIIYNKGQNLRRLLTSQYDDALKNFDVLAMPTIPFTASKLPDKTVSTKEYLETLGSISVNTRPHNLTGHPAISLNAGFHGNGLPVGTMLISKHFDEVTLFKVSYHFESINMPH